MECVPQGPDHYYAKEAYGMLKRVRKKVASHYAILSSNIIVCLQRTCLKEFSLNETIDTLKMFMHTQKIFVSRFEKKFRQSSSV